MRTQGLTSSAWPGLNYEAGYCSFSVKGDSFRQLLLSSFSLQLNTMHLYTTLLNYLIKWGSLSLYKYLYDCTERNGEITPGTSGGSWGWMHSHLWIRLRWKDAGKVELKFQAAESCSSVTGNSMSKQAAWFFRGVEVTAVGLHPSENLPPPIYVINIKKKLRTMLCGKVSVWRLTNAK